METVIEVTKSELIEAFKSWNKDVEANPEAYTEEHKEKAQGQADCLIEFLVNNRGLNQ